MGRQPLSNPVWDWPRFRRKKLFGAIKMQSIGSYPLTGVVASHDFGTPHVLVMRNDSPNCRLTSPHRHDICSLRLIKELRSVHYNSGDPLRVVNTHRHSHGRGESVRLTIHSPLFFLFFWAYYLYYMWEERVSAERVGFRYVRSWRNPLSGINSTLGCLLYMSINS